VSEYVSVYDLAEKLSVGVVKTIAGRIRATNNHHCDSCHEDHDEGYFPRSESWLEDDRYLNAKTGEIPWSLQFCCCTELNDFEDDVKRAIDRIENGEK
jgi:hypothetical protein